MDDYGKLQHWQNLLRSGEALAGEVTERMSDRMLELVAEGFEQERDPYGDWWEPKKRDDGRKILHGRTGKLRQFVSVPYGKGRFILAPGAEYGAFHQAPRDGRPKRLMVPSAERGLPREWSERLSKQALESMRTHFLRRQGSLFARLYARFRKKR
jgi:phage gpG-like protein